MMPVKRYTKEEFEAIPLTSRYQVPGTKQWVVIERDRVGSHTPIIVNPGTTDYPK